MKNEEIFGIPPYSANRLVRKLRIENSAGAEGTDPSASLRMTGVWHEGNVLGIDNAGRSEEPEQYFNLRSEIWCKSADMFADGDVQLKNIDHKLKGQLTTPTYEFRNGKILIESKADIKKRLGNSPDRADAYVNGLYAL